jgi:hypothetical protein
VDQGAVDGAAYNEVAAANDAVGFIGGLDGRGAALCGLLAVVLAR